MKTKPAVGLIGCGRIAREAHIPAYQALGVDVTALCDVDASSLQELGKLCPGARLFEEAMDLAAAPDVDIIDLATPPAGRPHLLRELLKQGKPILTQKPLCYSLEDAISLCADIALAKVPVAVNHNARWSPANARTRELLRLGKLGDLYSLVHVNRFNENIKTWYTDHPDYLFIDHGLHYIDLVRWLTGATPDSVLAIASYVPGQVALCPLQYSIQFRYRSKPLHVLLHFNNAVPAPGAFESTWYVDGTGGCALVSLDSVVLVDSDGVRGAPEHLAGGWVPDGFMGSYLAFVEALQNDTPPPHSVADHLESLRVAFGAAASARLNGRWVSVSTGLPE
jgi:predicted dehydrogenase